MEKGKRVQQKRFVDQFDTVVAFLCLEIIALMCFGLGGFLGIRILEILGFFVGLLTIPFIRNNFTKADFKKNIKWFIPLGAFFVLMGFSAFFMKYYGGFGLDALVYSLLEVLGLAGFFLLGFGMRCVPVIKKEYILYGFLGGLALYCVIVGFYSLIRYGFFYAGIYRGLSYYYQGVLYPIASEGKALYGFAFVEADLKFAILPSLILGLSGVGLIGLKPKENQRKFIILAVFASIGAVYSLLIPYWPSIIVMAATYVLALLYRLTKKLVGDNPKHIKNVGLTFTVLYFVLIAVAAVIALLLLLENRLGVISNILNGIIHRVPMSIQTAFEAINDCVYNSEADLHKVNLASLLFGYSPSGNALNVHPTRFFLINVLWENGLLAFLLLLFLVFFFIRNSRRFLKGDEENLSYRLSLIAMIFGVFAFINVFSSELPLVHGTDFLPMSQSQFMFALMFLLGLTYVPEKAKREVIAHE